MFTVAREHELEDSDPEDMEMEGSNRKDKLSLLQLPQDEPRSRCTCTQHALKFAGGAVLFLSFVMSIAWMVIVQPTAESAKLFSSSKADTPLSLASITKDLQLDSPPPLPAASTSTLAPTPASMSPPPLSPPPPSPAAQAHAEAPLPEPVQADAQASEESEVLMLDPSPDASPMPQSPKLQLPTL